MNEGYVENELVKDFIEVTLPDPENFLKIKETLTRIGIASRHENVLYQSCHILHKQGRYFIVHFKELFLLDGKVADISESDIQRRNTIATLLSDWGLLDIVQPDKVKEMLAPVRQIKIVKFNEKKDWDLRAKYTIGARG